MTGLLTGSMVLSSLGLSLGLALAQEPAPADDAAAPEAPPVASEPAPEPANPAQRVRVKPDGPDPWEPDPPPDPDAPPAVPTQEAAERQTRPPEVRDTLDHTEPSDRRAKRAKKKQDRREKRGYEKYESPQRFGVELKFGPYLPNIDRNYAGPRDFGSYDLIFGRTDDIGRTVDTPKKAFMFALGFEWQFFNPGRTGPLALGFTFSFFRDRANAIFRDYQDIYEQNGTIADDDLLPGDTSIRSNADKVSFSGIPLALQLVYRFELLADRLRVPIVPYAKGGVAYAFWWSKGADGEISVNSQMQPARGGSWGYQLNAGGMLRLDFLEGESHALDRQLGINHTYLFGEFQFSQVDNFGQADAISMGDTTFFVGLAMEF